MKYNLLGNTGLLVSELCLGTMTFGGEGFWQAIGSLQQEAVNDILKVAVEQGINFIDTANAYSFGQSEALLGQGIRQLGLTRDELVLATKVRGQMGAGPNAAGLSRGHLMQQVDASLKRLQVDYIDLYQIHGVDPLTPLEETMRGLEDIVRSGKVRYVGCCNLPAWMVMQANGIAAKHDWTPFVTTQNYYSIAGRDVERELVPLALNQQLSLLPWSPLAGGFLSGKFTRHNQPSDGSRRVGYDFPPVNQDKAYDIIDVMARLAQAREGTSVAQIALAWLLQQPAVTSVIFGAKNTAQLLDNVKATAVQLSTDEVAELEKVSAVPKEYPAWMVDMISADRLLPQQHAAAGSNAHAAAVEATRAPQQ